LAPSEIQVSHVLDGRRPTTLAHIVCKTLGVERIVRQKIEPFLPDSYRPPPAGK
jgi:hypothetical protein